ncbi:MAG TPA: AAA family ATPase [Streptosporangiaceae bacterium]
MALNSGPGPALYGRDAACETLAGVVSAARRGHGAVLVLRGETGLGKTALLDHTVGQAGDLRVIRATAAATETGLPFAGLHQLCGPLLSLLGRVPGPQRTALETVFGLRAGAGDRFLVNLGVLSLLAAAAAERPLLIAVDDGHWLDQASGQALAFVARRLASEPVALVLAMREPGANLAGLPELVLGGLADAAARDLLTAAMPWPLDDRVREQVVAEARGNPRTLLELRDLSPVRLAGGLGLPGAELTGESPALNADPVRAQLDGLPPPTRTLLLTAAADPTGDPALLWRAAEQQGLASKALSPAAEAGLVTVAGRVLFRDRLVRAAVYQAAPLGDRRTAHLAVARATDVRTDPDRRIWHQAQAGDGPDEAIAAELERATPRARARGGLAAAAAFAEQAAAMTPDADRRTDRTLAAAAVMLQAGEPGTMARLLATVEPGRPGDPRRVRADLLRARLAVVQNQGGDVPRRLLDIARQLDRSDTVQVRAAYLDAIRAAIFAAGLATPGGTIADVARAARKAPDPDGPDGPDLPDLLLDGLSAYLSEEYAAGAPALRQALNGFRSGRDGPGRDGPDRGGPGPGLGADELRWLPLACIGALALWDDAAWDALSSRFVRLSRDQGAVADLPLALDLRACLHLLSGDLTTAGTLAQEAREAAAAVEGQPTPYGALGLAALRGHRDPALALIGTAGQDAIRRGEGLGAGAAQWAAAVLHNGLGQYEDALAAAEQAVGYLGSSVLACWPAAELIEAAVRAGQPDRASDAADYLSRAACLAGSDWALGIRARSLALLSSAEATEDRYLAAIGALGRTRDRIGLARAHLLYGEWLRRANRRVDAREQLRLAHQLLEAMGVGGFAERARRELLATGETVRRRRADTERDLTAQELQIAVRARNGRTNTEIGAELFLSPRTVEWHLRKVFGKLGISSRRELRQALRG